MVQLLHPVRCELRQDQSQGLELKIFGCEVEDRLVPDCVLV